jgi:CRISPR/Cas system-associated protein Csm6
LPKHHIEISLPTKPLKNVDTTITVWSDNEKLGELRVSRGSLDWRSARKKSFKSISWERLATILDQE